MEARVTPLRLDREDEKKMLPCRFFANGYCHKGNRCRFYHPLNMGMNSIIRVPPLPPHFGGPSNELGRQQQQQLQQQQTQQQQGPQQSRIPPLFPISPPMNSASRGIHPNMNGLMNVPPPNVNYNNNNYSPSPPSPSYTEYDIPPAQSSFVFEPPASSPAQNTVFNHIDWSEFLAPGQAPPPPTQVPDERLGGSPGKKSEMSKLVSGLLHPDPPSSSTSNEDMPPEGRSQRKLTAKEELHMKVQEIAKELAEEPVTPIHSLDSFFRNFTFNAYSSVTPKLKSHGMSDEHVGDKGRASGDSNDVGGPTVPGSADHFTARDMADALMEIYIASEREREGDRDKLT